MYVYEIIKNIRVYVKKTNKLEGSFMEFIQTDKTKFIDTIFSKF